MLFFVRDSRNRTLYPSKKTRWADKLVQNGKAKWIRKKIIILKLNYEVKEPPRDQISYFVIGMDPGYGNIGYSVYKITGEVVQKIFSGTGLIRSGDIKDLVENRKVHRRARRKNQRKKSKTPKFKHPKSNRTKKLVGDDNKVFSRTCQHLLRSHLRAIQFITELVPAEQCILNFEYASFDLQQMTGNKSKKGKGTGGNEKAFVLARDSHTCQHCGKKNCQLEVHHKIQRKDGGTNQPSNLITLCAKCHSDHHNGKINVNGIVRENKTRTTTLGSIMPDLFLQLASDIPTYKFYGYETKEFRQKHGIEKTHANDASCIALMGLDFEVDLSKIIDYNIVVDFKQFRRHRRAVVFKREERKYHVLDDPKKQTVAWNRNRRNDQDPKKPALIEFRRANSGILVKSVPSKSVKYKTRYGTTQKTPGLVVRDLRTGAIHVVQATEASYVRTTTSVKIENRFIEYIKPYSGFVIL